jgi:Calcineurin-like phosphoesterase
MTGTSTGSPSSRESAAGAGWDTCSGPGSWKSSVPVGARPLSWMRPGTLWRARNDLIVRLLGDPIPAARVRWVRHARERAQVTGADTDFLVRRAEHDDISVLLMGDTGEGDDSQYALVPGLLSQADGVDFAVICSDVIYPTGDMGDYRDKFFRPYAALRVPIFAVPGNHDWYDGLQGFMYHMCAIDDPAAKPALGRTPRGWTARWLWRRSERPSDQELASMRVPRDSPEQTLLPPQPASYFALDAGHVRFVGIDTGVKGSIDADQAAWMRRVSFGDPRAKILVTGKPLYVDGVRHPGTIEGEPGTIDDVVRDPAANYVAAIGGDIHNYQRYPVTLPDGRTLQYVVSGGGGAFMHATHQIPTVDLPGVSEHDFRCYPLRGDSLAAYSRLYDKRLGFGRGLLELKPDEAAAYMSELLKLDPVRGTRVALSARARRAARLIQPLPATRGFHRYVSEVFDWNDPPMFKQFLRIDLTREAAEVRCFGVSGCAESEATPPVEDHFTIAL